MIEQYTIRQLLENYTLFVPEIQRDYVWGARENYREVLLPFLKALDGNLKGNKTYNIGFLYSYTNSKVENKVENYVIDGQQRFTTIVLLLYVLSVREHVEFTRYLSVNEPTMRFTYNVRPQTETFMRRLFKSGKVSSNDITVQTWFMPAYSSDTSITSMVNAVDKINAELDNIPEITFERILNQVCFWYFNVDETSQGEELYITMNSRGQKLTESEQIKPHLFDRWQKEKAQSEDNTDYGKLWDTWEEKFYSKKKREQGISSVDNAMNSFLKVVYEMVAKEECKDGIPARNELLSLPLIAKYMEAMLDYASNEWPKLLTEEIKYDPRLVLKALIAEGLKPQKTTGDIQRVERVFRNIVERRKYHYKHSDVLSFLHSYSKSSEPFYDFVIQSQSPIFDKHELDKIKIYKHFEDIPNVQKQIEDIFAAAEATKVWSGNISPLIRWSLKDEMDIFSIDIIQIENYLKKFNDLFGDDRLKKDMDVVRRALLASEFHEYPRIFRGNTHTSFAKDPEDWHILFLDEENVLKLKEFLDYYENETSLSQLIEDFSTEKNYSEFVHIPELLAYCKEKRIQWWWGTIYLISGSTANSWHANIHTYKYFLSRKHVLKFDKWEEIKFYHLSNSCLYIDHKEKNIAIDVLWNGGPKNRQMAIEVFQRDEKPEKIEQFLEPLLRLESFSWNPEKGRYAYYFDSTGIEQEDFKLMDDKFKSVVAFIDETITL